MSFSFLRLGTWEHTTIRLIVGKVYIRISWDSRRFSIEIYREEIMPYVIEPRGDKFAVINTDTKDVKGTHNSRIAAQRQINLLRGIEHGWEPTGAKAQK